ncbi:unnamed protein product [Linum tenue]|uniref:Uncharacterized protein n=1 Tax=Linum tenue TaxID=586396 RepID=A0AAV0Q2T6_9ROSI|nr:unnamed protein product [Linum tenue]
MAGWSSFLGTRTVGFFKEREWRWEIEQVKSDGIRLPTSRKEEKERTARRLSTVGLDSLRKSQTCHPSSHPSYSTNCVLLSGSSA